MSEATDITAADDTINDILHSTDEVITRTQAAAFQTQLAGNKAREAIEQHGEFGNRVRHYIDDVRRKNNDLSEQLRAEQNKTQAQADEIARLKRTVDENERRYQREIREVQEVSDREIRKAHDENDAQIAKIRADHQREVDEHVRVEQRQQVRIDNLTLVHSQALANNEVLLRELNNMTDLFNTMEGSMKSEMSKFQEVGQISSPTHRRITEDSQLLVGHVSERPVLPVSSQTSSTGQAYAEAGHDGAEAQAPQPAVDASVEAGSREQDMDVGQEQFTVRREDMIDTSDAAVVHDGQGAVVEFGQKDGTDGGETDIEADLQRQIESELAGANFGNGRARAANS